MSLWKSFEEVVARTKRTEFSGEDYDGKPHHISCYSNRSKISFHGVRPEGFCSIGDTEKPASDISDTQLITQLFDLPNLHLERQERDYGRLKAVGKVSTGIGISILPPHVQGAPIIARGLSIVKDIVKDEFLS